MWRRDAVDVAYALASVVCVSPWLIAQTCPSKSTPAPVGVRCPGKSQTPVSIAVLASTRVRREPKYPDAVPWTAPQTLPRVSMPTPRTPQPGPVTVAVVHESVAGV